MKIEGFLIASSKSHLFSHTPLRLLSSYATEISDNRHSHKNLHLDLTNIKCLDDGLRLYDEMKRITPLPSSVQFNQLLSRFVKMEEYSAAIHLYRDFCFLKIPINAYTMNIAINSYCRSNRVDFAFSILGSFLKRGCFPDSFTFAPLLKGLFRENRGNEGLDLFAKIVGEGLFELDVVVYGTVIDGLCKIGRVEAAMDLLRIMEKGRCKPNTHVYSMVIDALCREKQLDSALNLFDEMSVKEIRPDVVTYNTLISAMCNLKQWGEFDNLLKHMGEHKVYPDVFTFTFILRSLFHEGRLSEARKLFDRLLASGMKPSVRTYCTYLNGLFHNRCSEEALLLVDQLEQNGDARISYYNVVMHAFLKEKRFGRVREFFSGLRSKGLEPNVVTYNCVVRACLKRGEGDDAAKFIEEMVDRGVSPDERILELVLGVSGTIESTATLFRIARKLDPIIYLEKS